MTPEMCHEAVGDCIAALKLVHDRFVINKMIKISFTAFHASENIFYFNEYSGNVVFTCNGMGIFNIDLNHVNLDNTNYHGDDFDTIILIIPLA